MDKFKFVSRSIFIIGILNTLLGIIHIIGTFTFEPQNIKGQGSYILQRDYLLWFCATGLFILFMGLLNILCYKSLISNIKLAYKILLLCSGFTILLGAPGVVVFGISPPMVLVITGIFGLIALLMLKSKFE
jgi:hypothetical protein